MSEDLYEPLLAAGIGEPLARRLARYGARVLEANRFFNLTGAKTAGELVAHLLDSLSVAPFAGPPLCDVGSGAGLPGIPVALATGAPVTLVEATRKKAAFLTGVLAEFELAGEVIAQRAEIAAHDPRLREAFASGTARAVAAAPTVAELLLPFVAIGGLAILQRGPIDQRELTALTDACLMLGGEIEEDRRLDDRRRIVLVRKRMPTPARFPRRTGIPGKRPLCL